MKDVFIRSLKTFGEGVAACLLYAVSHGIDITDRTAVAGLVISALAAGVAAVINVPIKVIVGGKENA